MKIGSVTFNMRMDAEDYLKLRKAARQSGKSMSHYAYERIFGVTKPVSKCWNHAAQVKLRTS